MGAVAWAGGGCFVCRGRFLAGAAAGNNGRFANHHPLHAAVGIFVLGVAALFDGTAAAAAGNAAANCPHHAPGTGNQPDRQFLPAFFAGNGGGGRAALVQDDAGGGEKGAALTAVALNRLLDAFFGVTLGLAFWLLARQGDVVLGWVVLLGMVGLTAVCWLLFARFAPHLLTWLHSQMARWQQRWLVWLLEWVARLLVGTVAFAETAVVDLLLLGLVGAAQFLSTILTFVFLAWAVGVNLPLLLLGAIRSALQFTSLIPFAFLGVREAGLLALLTTMGVTAEKAVALSLLLAAQSVLTALLGGIIEIVQKTFSRSTQFETSEWIP